jgi:tetratricopeptide (TPR) repeat protein
MLRGLFLLLLIFWQNVGFCSSKIESYIEQQQYLTAWKEIQKLPQTPENIIYTTNFVLTYFTLSKMHQEFSFSNLTSDENLIQKRYTENSQTAKFYNIPLDTILNNAIKNNPNDGNLYISLGNYYFEVFLLYKKKWLINRQELMRLFEKQYAKAHQLKKYSDKSYYGLGFFEMFNGNYIKAIEYFENSYKLNPKNINSLHQLAVLYSESVQKNPDNEDHLKKAIDFSKKTLETFPPNQTQHLANMAFTIGSLYQQKNEIDSAIVYYLLADSYLPEEKDVLENLLICFLQKKRWTEVALTTGNLLNMEIKDVIMFQNILGIYEAHAANEILIENLQNQLNINPNDKERTGYLKLYLASVYFDFDKIEAKNWLLKSEKDFKVCYDSDHPVFLSIDKLNTQLSK